MAQYDINFSTNASKAAEEINRVNRELTRVIKVGQSIKLNLDTSSLSRGINATFGALNREIDNVQRKLSRLQIGSRGFRGAAASLGYREGQRERGELIAQPLRLRGQAQSFEQGSNVRLQKELQALQIEASQIAPNTVEWVKFQQQIAQINLELKKSDKLAEDIQLRENLGAFAPGSLAQLEAKLTLLRNKAKEITPNTTGWKQLNKEIQRLESGVARANKKPLSAGQRAGAAGGAFLYGGGLGGGVGSAVGGIAGGVIGGVPGAFTGAAIGQIADNLGTALAGITSQASAVQKMQRGLAMASVDAKDFAEAQAAVGETSQKLLMPLEQTTKYFAQLRANTKEYNLSVEETRQILEGTALAIMATGGSAEDLDGAMRAVVQIMSKGGVQAEELRGQLGERFPGAVVKFAQANKMSFEELQQGLENGQIGIRQFIEFAKKNYTDYAKFSEQLATAPEYAGQRLKIAFEQLSLEIGSLFGPMGADIQDTLTEIVNGIAGFVKDNRAYLRQMISDFGSIIGPIAKVFVELLKIIANFSVQVGKVFQGLFANIRQAMGMATIGDAKARLDKAKAATAGKTRTLKFKGGTTTSAAFTELDAAQKAFNDLGGQAAFNKLNAPTQPSNLTFGGAGAGMSIDREGKDRTKADQQAIKDASQLNRLLQQELELQNKLGLIDKDELSQIEAKAQLAKEILKLTLDNIRLTETGEIRQQSITNATLAYQVTVAELNEEWEEANKTIFEISENTLKLGKAIAGQGLPGKTALEEALEQIDAQAQEDIKTIDELLEKIRKVAGTRKESLPVKAYLGGLRTQIQERTPADREAMAGRKVTESIKTDLEGQVSALENAGKSFTTLDEIILKIGDDWNNLSPIVKTDLEILAFKIDSLKGYAEVASALKQSREELEKMTSASFMAIEAGKAIGDSFGEAFKGVVNGSMTAQQALASFFQSVGDYFVDMAARMIAEWVKMQIIGLVQSLLAPVAGGFAGAFGSTGPSFNAGAFSGPALSGGLSGAANYSSAFSGGVGGFNSSAFIPGFAKFANGGMVTGPTMGLVGEGRYNEAIVPLPNGKSIPVELGGGAGNQINSNITVNVNNGQAQSNATGSNSSELGRKIEGAVKQVIVGELRPGGLLASR